MLAVQSSPEYNQYGGTKGSHLWFPLRHRWRWRTNDRKRTHARSHHPKIV